MAFNQMEIINIKIFPRVNNKSKKLTPVVIISFSLSRDLERKKEEAVSLSLFQEPKAMYMISLNIL